MTETVYKEVATRRFEHLRAQIDKGLFGGSRFLPRKTTNLKDILFNHVEILSDDDYVARVRRYHQELHMSGDVVEKATKRAQVASATYMPPFTDKQGKILLKDSVLADSTKSDDDQLIILLEELAHAYYKQNQLPFNSIPDNSYRFLPYENKTKYLDNLNTIRRRDYGNPIPADPDQLVVRNSGFATTVWDPDLIPDVSLAICPINQTQSVMEEVRALILKTILMAKVKGANISPYKSVTDQLLDGLSIVNKLDINSPQNGEVVTTTAFIMFFATTFNMKENMETLITLLHEGDPDKFLQFVGERSQESAVFAGAYQQIGELIKSRFKSDQE